MRNRLLARAPLSNRLHLRVIVGLAVVALLAVSGVAVISYLLAAQGEQTAAARSALTETAVLREVVAGLASPEEMLPDVLASAPDVDALLLTDGLASAATGGLSAQMLPDPLPPDGSVAHAVRAGEPVLVTSSALPTGHDLVLVFDQSSIRLSIAELRRSVVVAAVLMVLALVAVLVGVAHRILQPVERTAQAAHRLAEGALGTRLGDETPHLFADLTTAFDEMAAALERTVQDLRDMESSQRRFVADVSHELRTPLQALSTASDLLAPAIPQLTGSAHRGAEVLVQEVGRMRRMVEDLMEISRLDAGNAELVVETVDVEATVRRLLRHRGWTDQVAVDITGELTVATDRRRLDSILSNLIGNALTHGASPVRIRARATEDALVVDVADAGPGVAPEDRDRIFERFSKADDARTRTGGSGLGLAIAREHARTLGASLTVESPLDGGAVFRLSHPWSVGTRRQPR